MKNKHILVVFILGIVVTTIGALLKIIHFEIGPLTGNALLTIGLLTKAIAALLFIGKLLLSKKTNEFLDK